MRKQRKMVKTLDSSWIGYLLMELNTQSYHRGVQRRIYHFYPGMFGD